MLNLSSRTNIYRWHMYLPARFISMGRVTLADCHAIQHASPAPDQEKINAHNA
jgi:hypothetical protein